MTPYRCATCGIQYPTRRALTYHLRKHKDKGEQHAACNDDSGHRSSSVTNRTSVKQTRYSALPDSSFDTHHQQPADSGDDGGRSSSGTNTTSAKQTSYSVLPDSSFDTSKQPAVSGGDGGISGLVCSSHLVGHADSLDALEIGNGNTLSNNLESPGAIGCSSPTKLFHYNV